jgi:hypothetical protein
VSAGAELEAQQGFAVGGGEQRPERGLDVAAEDLTDVGGVVRHGLTCRRV